MEFAALRQLIFSAERWRRREVIPDTRSHTAVSLSGNIPEVLAMIPLLGGKFSEPFDLWLRPSCFLLRQSLQVLPFVHRVYFCPSNLPISAQSARANTAMPVYGRYREVIHLNAGPDAIGIIQSDD